VRYLQAIRVVTLIAAILVLQTFRRNEQAKALRQHQHEHQRCSKLSTLCSRAAQHTASNNKTSLKITEEKQHRTQHMQQDKGN